jgi:hypothetical protein
MPSEGRQLELALSREQKLEIVCALRNRQPPLISRIVQKNMAKFIEQIELNAGPAGWCGLGQEVLAAKMGDIDRRTYYRWEMTAKALEFVETMPGPGLAAPNLVRVHWDVVARRAREGSRQVELAPIADLADAETVPICGKNVPPDGTNVPSHLLPSVGSYKNTFVPFTFKEGERSLVTQTSDKCPITRDIFQLSLGDLINPDRLDEWCQWAFSVGRAREIDKPQIFAAAHSVHRRNRAALAAHWPAAKIPGIGAFYSNVRARRWFASGADDDWARKALLYLDRQESGL